jgi:hypothetical protein
MHPDFVAEFIREFHAELNGNAATPNSRSTPSAASLRRPAASSTA